MIFTETELEGVYIIEPEPLVDERGFFARTFCKEEFREHGLETDIVQCNLSYNKKKGTLRGMHYQGPPYEETKMVSCIRGSIYDVVLDLRRDSATFRQWVALELNEKKYKMLYIPRGCYHGFETLEDETIVYYHMSELFHPECAHGIMWNDPIFKIQWPITKKMIISDKDRNFENFSIGTEETK